MFGSVMGSLATSMELAQSFLNQEEASNEAEDKGIEQFAEVSTFFICALQTQFLNLFLSRCMKFRSLIPSSHVFG